MTRILLALLSVVAVCGPCAIADDAPASRPALYVNHSGLSKLGWQLACVSSTFQSRSNGEMIDLLHSLNFHHIELSAGQFDPSDLNAADALAAKLKSVHMDIVSIGIIDPGTTEKEARKFFEFGKQLKIKTIVVDPADDSLETLDKLANEYRINVAIENFAKPGHHWDPTASMSLVAGRSSRVGFCADVAAWRGSGVSPVDAVKLLSGHILVVRPGSFDVGDAVDVLGELKDQKFKGICALGCAPQPESDLMDRFTRTINAFSTIVGSLNGSK